MIPKEKIIFEYKYNQSDTINNMARAIQSKQYNQQYGQSNQSNMVSNTINMNWGVVILSVALTQRSETWAKPDV